VTTYRLAPLKATSFQVTLLDSCGVPSTAACARFASKGLISIEQAGEALDQTEFSLVNADGDLEEYAIDPSRLKYLTVDITVSKAVPELIGWMTGGDVITDDAASPSSVGWKTQTNSSALSNFAIETRTRLLGESSCAGSAAYCYVLWPWLYDGSFTVQTFENGLSELKISAKTRTGSPWGTGPYSVNLSKAAATLGQPMGLYEAVDPAEDHRILQRTELAPPLNSTACGAVAGVIAVVDDDGAGAGLAATATIPLPVADTTPGYINWGDATAADPVAAGALTATHVYALAGPYTVTYRPSAVSDVVYSGSVTMA
jgi:hypothetical protein